MQFPERPNQRDVAYHFESLDFRAKDRKLHAFLAEFHHVPDPNLRPHSHAGVEVLYLLEGTLELKIGTENYRLEEGDAIYFDSVQKHSYRRAGQQRCSAIVVTTSS